jgi:dihydroneopterin aldolase
MGAAKAGAVKPWSPHARHRNDRGFPGRHGRAEPLRVRPPRLRRRRAQMDWRDLPDSQTSILEDVELRVRCGLHPWERHPERPNRLLVSVELYTTTAFDPATGAGYLDYDRRARPPADLAGAAARGPAGNPAGRPRRLRVRGPAGGGLPAEGHKPDIFPEAAAAGVEWFRRSPRDSRPRHRRGAAHRRRPGGGDWRPWAMRWPSTIAAAPTRPTPWRAHRGRRRPAPRPCTPTSRPRRPARPWSRRPRAARPGRRTGQQRLALRVRHPGRDDPQSWADHLAANLTARSS